LLEILVCESLLQKFILLRGLSPQIGSTVVNIGYARGSTLDQNLDLQVQALRKAGCRRIFREKVSGASRERPEFQRMIDQLRRGDTVIVWKLDRLARSTRDLLETMETLRQAGRPLSVAVRTLGEHRNSDRKADHDRICRHSRI
jgi:DNA invertase Pin-like site-specific DNA recombinase